MSNEKFDLFLAAGIGRARIWGKNQALLDQHARTPVEVRYKAIHASDAEYESHFLTKLSLLAGFPARNFMWDGAKPVAQPADASVVPSQKASLLAHLGNLARNVFRLPQPHSPDWQVKLSYSGIVPLLIFSWHLVMAIPTLLLNAVRLLTTGLLIGLFELLRMFGDFLIGPDGCTKLEKKLPDTAWVQVPLFVLFVIGMIAIAIAGIVLFLGATTARAIFSPVDNFQFFWNKGGIGKFFAILSALVTVSAYVALAVFALPAIVSLAPAYLPGFMVTGLNTALAGFTWFAGLGSTVLAPIGTVISGALGSVFVGTAITNAAIGLAAVTGVLVAVVGSLWSHFTQKFDDWYHSFAVRAFVFQPNASVIVAGTQSQQRPAVSSVSSAEPLNTKPVLQTLASAPATPAPVSTSASAPANSLVQPPTNPQPAASNPLQAPPKNLSVIQSAPPGVGTQTPETSSEPRPS